MRFGFVASFHNGFFQPDSTSPRQCVAVYGLPSRPFKETIEARMKLTLYKNIIQRAD
jgi:hypothetical protein